LQLTFISTILTCPVPVDRKHGHSMCFDLPHAQNVSPHIQFLVVHWFSFQSIALWERKTSIIILLGVLCLVHWGLLYRGMFIVTAVWNEAVRACVVTATNPSLLKITFFYSTFLARIVTT
jgi:hypothetical protein